MVKKERCSNLKFYISVLIICLIFISLLSYMQLTGRVVNEKAFGGPSAEDSKCLYQCVKIENKSEDICMAQCGVAPKPTNVNEDEKCMQDCILVGCDEYEIRCQNANMYDCEEKCNMKGDAPDESEISDEEKCISECVSKVDSSIICGAGTEYGEGETGNKVCQMCANECVHLYKGPCLDDAEITGKENDCKTCEHCYGEPVMGDSGEGSDCIIDIKCADASSEFGDEPGEGPGMGQEGYVPPNKVAKAVDDLIKGIKGLFS